jgi:hypothetical protein
MMGSYIDEPQQFSGITGGLFVAPGRNIDRPRDI